MSERFKNKILISPRKISDIKISHLTRESTTQYF